MSLATLFTVLIGALLLFPIVGILCRLLFKGIFRMMIKIFGHAQTRPKILEELLG